MNELMPVGAREAQPADGHRGDVRVPVVPNGVQTLSDALRTYAEQTGPKLSNAWPVMAATLGASALAEAAAAAVAGYLSNKQAYEDVTSNGPITEPQLPGADQQLFNTSLALLAAGTVGGIVGAASQVIPWRRGFAVPAVPADIKNRLDDLVNKPGQAREAALEEFKDGLRELNPAQALAVARYTDGLAERHPQMAPFAAHAYQSANVKMQSFFGRGRQQNNPLLNDTDKALWGKGNAALDIALGTRENSKYGAVVDEARRGADRWQLALDDPEGSPRSRTWAQIAGQVARQEGATAAGSVVRYLAEKVPLSFPADYLQRQMVLPGQSRGEFIAGAMGSVRSAFTNTINAAFESLSPTVADVIAHRMGMVPTNPGGRERFVAAGLEAFAALKYMTGLNAEYRSAARMIGQTDWPLGAYNAVLPLGLTAGAVIKGAVGRAFDLTLGRAASAITDAYGTLPKAADETARASQDVQDSIRADAGLPDRSREPVRQRLPHHVADLKEALQAEGQARDNSYMRPVKQAYADAKGAADGARTALPWLGNRMAQGPMEKAERALEAAQAAVNGGPERAGERVNTLVDRVIADVEQATEEANAKLGRVKALGDEARLHRKKALHALRRSTEPAALAPTIGSLGLDARLAATAAREAAESARGLAGQADQALAEADEAFRAAEASPSVAPGKRQDLNGKKAALAEVRREADSQATRAENEATTAESFAEQTERALPSKVEANARKRDGEPSELSLNSANKALADTKAAAEELNRPDLPSLEAWEKALLVKGHSKRAQTAAEEAGELANQAQAHLGRVAASERPLQRGLQPRAQHNLERLKQKADQAALSARKAALAAHTAGEISKRADTTQKTIGFAENVVWSANAAYSPTFTPDEAQRIAKAVGAGATALQRAADDARRDVKQLRQSRRELTERLGTTTNPENESFMRAEGWSLDSQLAHADRAARKSVALAGSAGRAAVGAAEAAQERQPRAAQAGSPQHSGGSSEAGSSPRSVTLALPPGHGQYAAELASQAEAPRQPGSLGLPLPPSGAQGDPGESTSGGRPGAAVGEGHETSRGGSMDLSDLGRAGASTRQTDSAAFLPTAGLLPHKPGEQQHNELRTVDGKPLTAENLQEASGKKIDVLINGVEHKATVVEVLDKNSNQHFALKGNFGHETLLDASNGKPLDEKNSLTRASDDPTKFAVTRLPGGAGGTENLQRANSAADRVDQDFVKAGQAAQEAAQKLNEARGELQRARNERRPPHEIEMLEKTVVAAQASQRAKHVRLDAVRTEAIGARDAAGAANQRVAAEANQAARQAEQSAQTAQAEQGNAAANDNQSRAQQGSLEAAKVGAHAAGRSARSASLAAASAQGAAVRADAALKGAREALQAATDRGAPTPTIERLTAQLDSRQGAKQRIGAAAARARAAAEGAQNSARRAANTLFRRLDRVRQLGQDVRLGAEASIVETYAHRAATLAGVGALPPEQLALLRPGCERLIQQANQTVENVADSTAAVLDQVGRARTAVAWMQQNRGDISANARQLLQGFENSLEQSETIARRTAQQAHEAQEGVEHYAEQVGRILDARDMAAAAAAHADNAQNPDVDIGVVQDNARNARGHAAAAGGILTSIQQRRFSLIADHAAAQSGPVGDAPSLVGLEALETRMSSAHQALLTAVHFEGQAVAGASRAEDSLFERVLNPVTEQRLTQRVSEAERAAGSAGEQAWLASDAQAQHSRSPQSAAESAGLAESAAARASQNKEVAVNVAADTGRGLSAAQDAFEAAQQRADLPPGRRQALQTAVNTFEGLNDRAQAAALRAGRSADVAQNFATSARAAAQAGEAVHEQPELPRRASSAPLPVADPLLDVAGGEQPAREPLPPGRAGATRTYSEPTTLPNWPGDQGAAVGEGQETSRGGSMDLSDLGRAGASAQPGAPSPSPEPQPGAPSPSPESKPGAPQGAPSPRVPASEGADAQDETARSPSPSPSPEPEPSTAQGGRGRGVRDAGMMGGHGGSIWSKDPEVPLVLTGLEAAFAVGDHVYAQEQRGQTKAPPAPPPPVKTPPPAPPAPVQKTPPAPAAQPAQTADQRTRTSQGVQDDLARLASSDPQVKEYTLKLRQTYSGALSLGMTHEQAMAKVKQYSEVHGNTPAMRKKMGAIVLQQQAGYAAQIKAGTATPDVKAKKAALDFDIGRAGKLAGEMGGVGLETAIGLIAALKNDGKITKLEGAELAGGVAGGMAGGMAGGFAGGPIGAFVGGFIGGELGAAAASKAAGGDYKPFDGLRAMVGEPRSELAAPLQAPKAGNEVGGTLDIPEANAQGVDAAQYLALWSGDATKAGADDKAFANQANPGRGPTDAWWSAPKSNAWSKDPAELRQQTETARADAAWVLRQIRKGDDGAGNEQLNAHLARVEREGGPKAAERMYESMWMMTGGNTQWLMNEPNQGRKMSDPMLGFDKWAMQRLENTTGQSNVALAFHQAMNNDRHFNADKPFSKDDSVTGYWDQGDMAAQKLFTGPNALSQEEQAEYFDSVAAASNTTMPTANGETKATWSWGAHFGNPVESDLGKIHDQQVRERQELALNPGKLTFDEAADVKQAENDKRSAAAAADARSLAAADQKRADETDRAVAQFTKEQQARQQAGEQAAAEAAARGEEIVSIGDSKADKYNLAQKLKMMATAPQGELVASEIFEELAGAKGFVTPQQLAPFVEPGSDLTALPARMDRDQLDKLCGRGEGVITLNPATGKLKITKPAPSSLTPIGPIKPYVPPPAPQSNVADAVFIGGRESELIRDGAALAAQINKQNELGGSNTGGYVGDAQAQFALHAYASYGEPPEVVVQKMKRDGVLAKAPDGSLELDLGKLTTNAQSADPTLAKESQHRMATALLRSGNQGGSLDAKGLTYALNMANRGDANYGPAMQSMVKFYGGADGRVDRAELQHMIKDGALAFGNLQTTFNGKQETAQGLIVKVPSQAGVSSTALSGVIAGTGGADGVNAQELQGWCAPGTDVNQLNVVLHGYNMGGSVSQAELKAMLDEGVLRVDEKGQLTTNANLVFQNAHSADPAVAARYQERLTNMLGTYGKDSGDTQSEYGAKVYGADVAERITGGDGFARALNELTGKPVVAPADVPGVVASFTQANAHDHTNLRENNVRHAVASGAVAYDPKTGQVSVNTAAYAA